MKNPHYLLVLADGTHVWQKGYDEEPTDLLAVYDYYADYEYPDTDEPAYKCYGSFHHSEMYVREADVEDIIDLYELTEDDQ